MPRMRAGLVLQLLVLAGVGWCDTRRWTAQRHKPENNSSNNNNNNNTWGNSSSSNSNNSSTSSSSSLNNNCKDIDYKNFGPTGPSSLRLVSVVFRHGDRAPDPVERFRFDPNANETFWPQGLGGMTNSGKRRTYSFGEELRARYDAFLGPLYLPGAVVARSTDYQRTKMCLQLVLAGLYPPAGIQIWSKKLAWQPIPATYSAPEDDWLMIPEYCPRYVKERARVEQLAEVRSKIEGFREFMNRLSELTGKSITRPNDMYNLYHILVAEKAMNLELASWTAEYFPRGRLLDGINLEYEIFSYNTLMRRLNGGKLLHRIVSDMKRKAQLRNDTSAGAEAGAGNDEAHKISLFSGHETNVAALLQALGVYEPHVPEYTSAVIVELHEKKGCYFVKVLYHRGIPAVTEDRIVPGCDVLCPLDKFVELLKDVIPTRDELSCDAADAA